jgi:hypothetical protein
MKYIFEKISKISQQLENLKNRNGPDLVQAFPKKWWIQLPPFAQYMFIDSYWTQLSINDKKGQTEPNVTTKGGS